jgi:MFS family permease
MTKIERIARRGDLITLFAMVFLADVAIGIQRATFSLFAVSLGATLTMVGFLGGMEGLTGLLSAVPIGSLSDRVSRRVIVGGGLLIFAVSFLLCSVIRNPYLLFPIRVMTGVAVGSIFYLGIALVSDLADKPDQGLSIGLYTTCMGVGFAIGTGLGGRLAEDFGFSTGYQVAAVIALLSLAVFRWGLGRAPARPSMATTGKAQSLSARFSILGREPVILAACIGNLGMAMANEGAILGFFPLYAASLAIGTAVIGSIFSARMLSSSAARLPTGALSGPKTSRRLIIIAMAISMLCMFAIPFARSATMLGLILTVEGIAFGMYFTAGNAAIAEHTTAANRGLATGLFVMAGSLGVTLGPIGLGAAAERWDLGAVFWLTGAVMLVGLIVILFLQVQARRKASPPTGGSGSCADPLTSRGQEISVGLGHEPDANLAVIG